MDQEIVTGSNVNPNRQPLGANEPAPVKRVAPFQYRWELTYSAPQLTHVPHVIYIGESQPTVFCNNTARNFER